MDLKSRNKVEIIQRNLNKNTPMYSSTGMINWRDQRLNSTNGNLRLSERPSSTLDELQSDDEGISVV